LSSKPLQNSDFRHLFKSQTISGLGDWMGTFALMAAAYGTSESASAVGGILTLRLLPAILGGSLAARIAVKWDKRRTMLTMEFLRMGIIAVVPFIAELWWIYMWAFFLEACSIVFLSARDATVPSLVPQKSLSEANSWLMGSSYGTIPFGAGLFAAIAAIPWGAISWFESPRYALVFWLDALTFLASAMFIARIRVWATAEASVSSATSPAPADSVPPPAEITPPATAGASSEPRGRLRDAWKIPLVRSVLPATLSAALGLGALFSLGISLVRDELGASTFQFAVLIILFGLGAVAGLLLTRKIESHHLAATRNGVLLMGALIATMSLSPFLWLTFVGALGFGACVTVALVSGITALQKDVSHTNLVTAFASFHVVIRGALALSAVVTGAVADGIGDALFGGTRLVLLAAGFVVACSALAVKLDGPHLQASQFLKMPVKPSARKRP